MISSKLGLLATSTFLDHGENHRSKRGCCIRVWPPGVICETNPKKTVGIGGEVTLTDIANNIIMRYYFMQNTFNGFCTNAATFCMA